MNEEIDAFKSTKQVLELIGLSHEEINAYFHLTGRGPVMVGEIALLINVEDNEAKIITTIKDKDDEWVLLLTDTIADTFFPEYLIEKIRQNVLDEKLRKKTAIKHLEILEQVYKK